jgi:hypothetical protein
MLVSIKLYTNRMYFVFFIFKCQGFHLSYKFLTFNKYYHFFFSNFQHKLKNKHYALYGVTNTHRLSSFAQGTLIESDY